MSELHKTAGTSAEYTEVLDPGYFKPAQYLPLALQAIASLRWQVFSVAGNTIVCYTPANGASFGEQVTIAIEKGKTTFHSKALNEYYWPADQNKHNADQFKIAIGRAIELANETDRNTHPANRELLGALVPSRSYIVTPIIIYLNILVFLCMIATGISIVNPDVQSLTDWGGNFRTLTAHGQWWRLITYMFLHGGIMHLLMNVYALLYIGMFLEPLLGKFRFTAAYLLTGVCAGLLSVSMHSYSVGVGASGAIFGMYGVFLAVLTTNHIKKSMRNTMLRSILFFVILNLMFGLQGNVDNAAHIGGLLSGLVMGYILYPGMTRQHGLRQQAATTMILVLATVALALWTLPRLTDDLAIYDRTMHQFATQEAAAIKAYPTKTGGNKEDMLRSIKDTGIYYWTGNIELMSRLQSLDLPPVLMERDKNLLLYCKLRKEQYELLYKEVAEGTGQYAARLADYNRRITALTDSITHGGQN